MQNCIFYQFFIPYILPKSLWGKNKVRNVFLNIGVLYILSFGAADTVAHNPNLVLELPMAKQIYDFIESKGPEGVTNKVKIPYFKGPRSSDIPYKLLFMFEKKILAIGL